MPMSASLINSHQDIAKSLDGFSRASCYSVILLVAVVLLLFSNIAIAEPWMAVQSGGKCMVCHVNPTGGGKRNEFGHIYGLNTLTAETVTDYSNVAKLTDRVSFGGDLRVNAVATQIPNQTNKFVFESEEILFYVETVLIPGRLTFYFDERLGPGGASNRELYGLYWFRDRSVYLKAGRMFLPYGLRLEDDTAFIRQVTGINYNTPDDGMEIGLELDHWSMSLAITNGTAGGSETNKGKQYSLLASYVEQAWRAGFSYNFNDVNDEDRTMTGVFAGLRTGIFNWLAEIDVIIDDGAVGGQLKQNVALFEVNAMLNKGHNIKASYEYFDPSRSLAENERTRISLVWEWFPMPFTQLSIGVRDSSGIPQNDLQNTTEWFVQLHNYL